MTLKSTFQYAIAGVTYPSGAIQKELLQQVYSEAKINPADVSYVEAHGTGTKAGDPEEANAITDVFCKGRSADSPLLIGSVKSNMGHPEPASGLAGVTKVLLAMQNGVLPPNLHYKKPNPDIPALVDGRLKVRIHIYSQENVLLTEGFCSRHVLGQNDNMFFFWEMKCLVHFSSQRQFGSAQYSTIKEKIFLVRKYVNTKLKLKYKVITVTSLRLI